MRIGTRPRSPTTRRTTSSGRPRWGMKSIRLIAPLPSAVPDGGRDRDRTCDPYHVKVVLFR